MDDPTSRARTAARDALEGHPWWTYRACAPADGDPATARGDRRTPVAVWLTPDRETQKDRHTREPQATALCRRCPLQAQCLAYALGDDTGPYEPWDVWGGMTAHQRGQLLKDRKRQTAPPANTGRPAHAAAAAGDGASARDRAVLCALAAHRTPHAVARACRLPVARANWHRAKLVTLLRLDPDTATRTQLLYAARRAGLLDPATPILSDRGVTAAVPSRQAAVTRSRGTQLLLPGMLHYTRTAFRQERPGAGTLHLVPAHRAGAARLAAAA